MKFSYTGVEVRNMDESIRFYSEGLGMELLDRHPIKETGGEVAALKRKDSPQLLELNWYPYSQSEYRPGSELDHLAFEVDDVKAAVERLVKLSAKPARDIEVRAKYTVGFVKDPDGVWIELYAPRSV